MYKKIISLSLLALSAQVNAELVSNGDGTITDNITNLVWQQIPETNKLPAIEEDEFKDSAINSCETLELAGFEDWRLPRIDELLTTIDYKGTESLLDPMFGGEVGEYWSSTPLSSSDSFYWFVYLDNYSGINHKHGPSDEKSYRCVRGVHQASLNTSEYLIIHSANVIKDPIQNLYWQRYPEETQRTAETAVKYCDALELDGFNDWYLPEITELQTIIDFTEKNAYLAKSETFFNNEQYQLKGYWSNTKNALEGGNSQWIISSFGKIDETDSNFNNYVRCARKGETIFDPQPNTIILNPDFTFNIPRLKYIDAKGNVMVFNVDFGLIPDSSGKFLFEVKKLTPIK